MTDARVGRALLALCGHRAGEVSGLSVDDWVAIDSLAHQHRLRPFLHGRLARGEISEIPAELAKAWQEAHRANAMMMLVQRRALLQATEALAKKRIASVALKGSALAWTVWPSPAERVMRDIDLLVAEDNAPRAYALLRETGWKAPDLSETEAQAFVTETHFPPLHSPDGVMCELHAHAWGRPPLPGTGMPQGDDAGLLERAERNDALRFAVPSAEDMLAHLVVHAACSHLLNVGPMALVDIDLCCTEESVDWPTFWRRASRDGYARPAALIFALAERWRSPGFHSQTGCELRVESALLDEAELLLVQDLDARKDVSAIASAALGKLGGRAEQHPLDRAEDKATFAGRFAQLGGRAVSLGQSLLSARTRRDGIATAHLQRWMES